MCLAAGWGGRSASCICAVGLGPGGFPERSQGSSVSTHGQEGTSERGASRPGHMHTCAGHQSMMDPVWSLAPFKHSIANVGPGDSVLIFTMHLSYSSAPVTSYVLRLSTMLRRLVLSYGVHDYLSTYKAQQVVVTYSSRAAKEVGHPASSIQPVPIPRSCANRTTRRIPPALKTKPQPDKKKRGGGARAMITE